jgi:hypothetical protein
MQDMLKLSKPLLNNFEAGWLERESTELTLGRVRLGKEVTHDGWP